MIVTPYARPVTPIPLFGVSAIVEVTCVPWPRSSSGCESAPAHEFPNDPSRGQKS